MNSRGNFTDTHEKNVTASLTGYGFWRKAMRTLSKDARAFLASVPISDVYKFVDIGAGNLDTLPIWRALAQNHDAQILVYAVDKDPNSAVIIEQRLRRSNIPPNLNIIPVTRDVTEFTLDHSISGIWCTNTLHWLPPEGFQAILGLTSQMTSNAPLHLNTATQYNRLVLGERSQLALPSEGHNNFEKIRNASLAATLPEILELQSTSYGRPAYIYRSDFLLCSFSQAGMLVASCTTMKNRDYPNEGKNGGEGGLSLTRIADINGLHENLEILAIKA